MIETVDSQKLADDLNSRWIKVSKEPLKVLIQVNTSEEEGLILYVFTFFFLFYRTLICFVEKNGIEPNQVVDLYRYVTEKCQNLKLEGLMTIGKFGHDYTIGPNPDFTCLLKCHDDVCTAINLDRDKVEISMGMSDDFEQAVS